MIITKTNKQAPVMEVQKNGFAVLSAKKPVMIRGAKRLLLAFRVRFQIFKIALKCYGSFFKALSALKKIMQFKKAIYGKSKLRKAIKLDGRYFFGIYIPPFPSPGFDRYIQTELNFSLPHQQPVDHLQLVQLAITNRCPLKCDHCFEWDNLNREEAFTINELKILLNKYQEAGCTQFHITGGEPMTKIKELTELVSSSNGFSDFWVLTSGFHVTPENASMLKQAGVTGIVISLDHYDPVMHNLFRHSDHAFEYAMQASVHAKEAGLLTAFSICTIRSFVTRENLFRYADLAKACEVSFVQLLEPKAVGHFRDKPVLLIKEHTDILDDFYLTINYNKKYQHYPLFIYHGYYQRKIGCLSGGNRILYIDSAGYINACPFCQTKSYHASDIISGILDVKNLQLGGCPQYKNYQNIYSESAVANK